MTWVAGIDGGGTSTRLQVRDAQNAVLSSAEFGPFNIASIGEQAFCQRLDELWAACPALANCAALCIGGAGVSSPKARQLLEASLAQRGFAGALMLCSDFEIALRGAMDGPGCILIAGTGSVGFGRNTAGQTARVGGWGHLIDDCGSGYALGRAALALAVQTADGRADAQTLLKAVYQATGSQDVQGILNYVYYSGQDNQPSPRWPRRCLPAHRRATKPAWRFLGRVQRSLRASRRRYPNGSICHARDWHCWAGC